MSRPPVSMVPVFALPVPPAAGFQTPCRDRSRIVNQWRKHTARRRRHLASKGRLAFRLCRRICASWRCQQLPGSGVIGLESVTVTSPPRTGCASRAPHTCGMGFPRCLAWGVNQIDNLFMAVGPHTSHMSSRLLPLVTGSAHWPGSVVGNGGYKCTRGKGPPTKTSSS